MPPQALPDGAPPSPVRALEDAIRPALLRPPCVVGFSGGRDSSALLAVAVGLARREGLGPPVPVSVRFPGAPCSLEDGYQQSVIAYLRLPDHEAITLTDELDVIGPVARRLVEPLGVVWPPNAHLTVLLGQRARGGSLIVGVGGDEVLGGWAFGRRRDARWLASVTAPSAIRRIRMSRRRARHTDWIRPPTRRRLAHAFARDLGCGPRRFDRHLAWTLRARYLPATLWTIEQAAATAGATAFAPLMDPGFVGALARAGGSTGLGDRAQLMGRLFGDRLPPDVVRRPTKASFTTAFISDRSREFASTWDGSGLDETLVDVEVLRRGWLSASPPFLTAMLLQTAWRASWRRAAPPAD